MMGRTTAFPSQFSGKRVKKKKGRRGGRRQEIAEGNPENPRADAQRSDRERRPGSSRQAQGGRRDGATTRRGYERGPKRTRRETKASDAGDADASEETCIPSKALESDKQQRRRERETVRESERVR